MKLLASSMLCALALGACASDSNEPPFVDVDGDGVNDNDPTALRTFTMRVENVAPFTILKSSVSRTKPDKTDGNLAPGEYYEIRFSAGVGHRLTFASMLFESNDWFFGTDPAGIPLYDASGNPLSGDITNQVVLWDAGTEYDQEPGVGADTGINQATRTQGQADPDHTVRRVADTVTLSNGTQFTRPSVASMIKLTLTPGADRTFVLRVENVSTTSTLVTSQGPKAITVTPILWVIHCDTYPNVLFDENAAPRDNGLEVLAEGATPDSANDKLRLVKGVATPLSPGLAVIHADGNPLFMADQPDAHMGLERLAEDGDISGLIASLDQNIILEAQSYATFDAPVDGTQGPCHAGQAYELTFKARPGDRLSFATAFQSSNDWFIAPPGEGMPLFNGNLPRWGEITNEFKLWDLGTERDQELDVGKDVGTQQTTPNTGTADSNKMVREVGRDRYDVPLTRHVRITLTPPMK